jgi:predicted TIM-barrel fold metal-dependent hydrolase
VFEFSTSRPFDANVLLGPLPQRPPGAPEKVKDLLATLDTYGIGQALVTHTVAKWHDPWTGNRRLVEEIVGEERLVPCWTVLPSATGEAPPEEEQIAQMLAAGARAARLCPVAHRLAVESWELDRLFGALAERHVPLLLDLDNRHWSEPRPWRVIEWACRTYPALTVVLLRESQANFRTLFTLLDRYRNLVVETSYLQGHDAINRIVERWGAERLIFGTGLPIWDPALPIAGLSYAGLSNDALGAVTGGTLRRLLNGCLQ